MSNEEDAKIFIPFWVVDRNGDMIAKEAEFSFPENVKFHHGNDGLSVSIKIDVLPVEMGDGYVSISTMGIPSGDLTEEDTARDGALRKMLEKLDCPIKFYRVLSCGCREGADLRVKQRPSIRHHRRLHGGRWSKLSRRNGR